MLIVYKKLTFSVYNEVPKGSPFETPTAKNPRLLSDHDPVN
jgi:hypothetical protein